MGALSHNSIIYFKLFDDSILIVNLIDTFPISSKYFNLMKPDL